MAKQITESQKIHLQWYEDAKKQTPETIASFVKGLMEDYQHDYGTICHAISAGAIGQAWAMNSHENGGITGFQAGAVMWGFVREWNYSSNKTGLKIIDFDNFLYPQYEDNFQKTIDEDVWKSLQKESVDKIAKAREEYQEYLVKKEKYDAELVDFIKKYPDYQNNKKHYDRLSMGTGQEWEDEAEKVESGFEFAPQEPYAPITDGSSVFEHWKTIAAGIVPFGYTVIKSK